MNPAAQLYTISADKPFLATLAGWVLEFYGKSDLPLTQVLILLPNRRACRGLREALLERTGGRPMLLPRIQPVGDVEQEELILYNQVAGSVPPAIAPMRRQLLLAQLVMDFEKKSRRTDGRPYDTAQAAELARQLMRFIDEVTREGLDFNSLASLVPDELAIHWQQTLDFLKIVSQHWPQVLEEEKVIEPVARRNQLLLALADAWRAQPPSHPIIAAGSTGSQPATAALLSVIARLPQGKVILPALDSDMPEEEWKLVAHTHPQFGIKQLLQRIDCKRSDVKPLVESISSERLECLRTILQPPAITSCWMQVKPPLNGLDGMQIVEADTLADEARFIAIGLRETLETPAKTAALVTPDRRLARMVAAQMQRFGITVDDSAGRALKDTPAAAFMRLVVEAAVSGAAPAAILSLLRHPLAACGVDPAECRLISRQLEKNLLRGIRNVPGFNALHDAAKPLRADYPGLVKLLGDLAKQAKPFMQLFAHRKSVSLDTLLTAHIALCEWVAATDLLHGAERLWAGESGNQLGSFLSELMPHAANLSTDPASYPGLFETLLADQVWRPSYGAHPRLHILSPIEARLQSYDLVILGGLNEGSWPALPAADPWMSRPMRHAFGLNAPESAIGQSAHDFYLLAAAPEVWLTRARKVDGIPTVASRWLVRLQTFVEGRDPARFKELLTERYEQARDIMDAPLPMEPISAPVPKPPAGIRPRQLKVTAIDTWLRDPYMVYVDRILRLRMLEPLDREPGAADFGTIIHRAMESFCHAYPEELPEDAQTELLKCGSDAFSDFMNRPAVAALWWPRFEAMSGWLITQEIERRRNLSGVFAEVRGQWTFDVDGKPFTLTTSIDRLEADKAGNAVIVDYKTGSIPSAADIERGLANQLLLEALIAMEGKLVPSPGIVKISELAYWKLTGNAEECEIRPVEPKAGLETSLEEARERLMSLIRLFDNPATPYAAQTYAGLRTAYNDYEHLTRAQEWEAV